MLQVWHNEKFLDFEKFKYDNVDVVYLPKNQFQIVANIEAGNLDDAFRLTQNIDEPWSENEHVIPIGKRHRSTSVGDVIRKDDEYSIVMIVGFKKFVFLESPEQAYALLEKNEYMGLMNFQAIVKYCGIKYIMERENGN
jgi:hypothetical protein